MKVQVAYRKLAILHSAATLHDLKSPGLQLEALREDRVGQHSIRINERRSSKMPMKPPHPGDTLKDEYLAPCGMSVNALAKAQLRNSG